MRDQGIVLHQAIRVEDFLRRTLPSGSLHKLKNQPELRKELGQNGMKYVHENLTFHKVGNVLSRCIEGCKK